MAIALHIRFVILTIIDRILLDQLHLTKFFLGQDHKNA